MKVRNKKTGEIFKIASYAKIPLDVCDSSGTPIELNFEDAELLPTEQVSEDERIRKALVEIFSGCIKDNEFCHTGFTYAEITDWLEKQTEQKPSEYLPKQKVFDIMNKLTNLSYSERIPIDSEEYVKIHEITSDVNSLLDYPIEQKPSWSEEDKAMIKSILFVLESYVSKSECASSPSLITTYPTYYKEIDWLKSLRPSWKPSEEQMDRLFSIVAALRKDDCDDMADFLAEIYHGLEKL